MLVMVYVSFLIHVCTVTVGTFLGNKLLTQKIMTL